MMKFDLPKDTSSIIKVIGVGGGGGNAVNHMYRQGIKDVDFVVCNTDQQALDMSPVPLKIQLGSSLTEGRGAGSIPEVGMNAAIENLDEIKDILEKNTKMVFVTAGMGGGTGTGAGPVIAQLAKDMGILTVGIVTIPFAFEGRKRRTQAEEGIEKMRNAVDTLLIINNDKLREMFGNLTLANAFSQADDVLSTAAKGIAEVISVTGSINVDFNDVNTVMKDSGVAIMGSAEAEGDNRAHSAVEKALSSPLLNDNQIKGAKYVLLNITYGEKEVLMDEIADITDYIQDEAGSTADVIWGHGYDETLGDKICVTLIATGFKSVVDTGLPAKTPERVKVSLNDERPTMITQPIENPITSPIENKIVKEDIRPEIAEEIKTEPFLVKPEETVVEPIEDTTTVEPIFEIEKPEIESSIIANIEEEISTETTNFETTTAESIVDAASETETTTMFDFNPTVAQTNENKTTEASFDNNEEINEEVELPTFEAPANPVVEEKQQEITSYNLEDYEDDNSMEEVVSETEFTTKENITTEWNFTPPVAEEKEEPVAEQPKPEVTKTWLEDEVVSKDNNTEIVNQTEQPQAEPSQDGVVRYMLTDDEDTKEEEETNTIGNNNFQQEQDTTQPTKEDNAELAKLRLERIRKTGNRMNTQEGLDELEKEPAYLRRNIKLDDVNHSSESTRSRFSLSDYKDEEGNDKTGLSDNNSFLHDNVD